MAVALALVLPMLGCQSFQPFQRTVQPKLAMAKKWVTGGVDALHNGQLAQAKSFFSRAARENPRDPMAQVHLARALQQNGETQQAIPHLQRATQLKHNDPRLVVELGEMYLDHGQWLPARNQADRAIEIDHRFAAAWILKGKTNLAKNDLHQALADFQRAASIDATQPNLQILIAQTYQQLGQPLKSLAAAEQLLGQHPPDQQPEMALILKSRALLDLKQHEPAIDILQAASERPEATSEVFLRLSQAQLLAGQDSQARLTLARAKRAFPEQPQFEQLLAELQSSGSRVAQVGTTLR